MSQFLPLPVPFISRRNKMIAMPVAFALLSSISFAAPSTSSLLEEMTLAKKQCTKQVREIEAAANVPITRQSDWTFSTKEDLATALQKLKAYPGDPAAFTIAHDRLLAAKQ